MIPSQERQNLKVYRGFYQELFKRLCLYWKGPEKKVAWFLFLGTIFLTFAIVGCQAVITFWYNQFYNSLQNYDVKEFWRLMGWFLILALTYISCAIAKKYFFHLLALKWRQFMTIHYVNLWLSEGLYYFLEFFQEKTDNPDQRLADDLNNFTSQTLSIFFLFFEAGITFFTFIGILWTLSGPLELSFWGLNLYIPGYLVLAALLYTILGTWIAHHIVAPLLPLSYKNEMTEGNFRYNLVRIRENSESIAFYKGEERERSGLKFFFQEIYLNTIQIIHRTFFVNLWSHFYGQIAIIAPYLLVASRFFKERLPLGFLMQLGQTFKHVDDSLSIIISHYPTIISWKASTLRILTFEKHLKDLSLRLENTSMERLPEKRDGFLVEGLILKTPHDVLITEISKKEFHKGKSILIQGPSGIGKSTFLRAIAGLWPFGEGRIRQPLEDSIFFLPQKPYIPLGSLAEAITYPQENASFSRESLEKVLTQVGLEKLMPSLFHYQNWSGALSGGEQQRLAFARLLLKKPDWVFLDEATSALDEASEKYLYELLQETCPKTTFISVGHRPSLVDFHQDIWNFPLP